MNIDRELKDHEVTAALVAGQIVGAARALGADETADKVIQNAIGTAQRIIGELVARTDGDDDMPAPMLPGILFIDEHTSQRNDGSDKQRGISVVWKRGEEFGYEGDELLAWQSRSLMGAIIRAVEEWVDSEDGSSDLTVDHDNLSLCTD